MQTNTIPTATAVLLLTQVITVLVPVFLLQTYFHFPDILRQPAAIAFALFRQNESVIVPAYYVFMGSGLLYVPLSVLLKEYLNRNATQPVIWLNLMVTLGVATAIFQAIGFSPWIILMPYLTDVYFGAANQSLQDSVTLLYEIFNRYAGTTIGEHLGFIAMGSWAICLAIAIRQSGRFNKWTGYAGILIGLLIISSIAEHFGGSSAAFFGRLNFVANTLWTIWITALAGMMLFASPRNKPVMPVTA